MQALDVDEVVGQLLAREGFRSGGGTGLRETTELASIQGFDEDTADEIQERAKDYLARSRPSRTRAARAWRRRRS
jgi:N utilization substance protein A